MLFASIIKSFFLQKNFTKKKVVFNKMSRKNKFRFKIVKFLVNFKKPLLGLTPFRRIPPKTRI